MSEDTRSQWPRITFGIIVLNGEPFTRYCLRSLYPFAHQIVVVEGGHEDTQAVATPDGHSIDGTLEALRRFKAEEDPLDKVEIVTRDGFWPKTDELGRHRTAQSRAYAERATGDYLWQVDIDEFYRPEDMAAVLSMLGTGPHVTAVSFRTRTFWGRPQYVADCWELRRGARDYHRLFKWGAGYRYVTHEPPTVIDSMGRDLRTLSWIRADEIAQNGVFLFHYSLLFPWQVEQKVRIYKDEKPDVMGGIVDWAMHAYFTLERPYRVHPVPISKLAATIRWPSPSRGGRHDGGGQDGSYGPAAARHGGHRATAAPVVVSTRPAVSSGWLLPRPAHRRAGEAGGPTHEVVPRTRRPATGIGAARARDCEQAARIVEPSTSHAVQGQAELGSPIPKVRRARRTPRKPAASTAARTRDRRSARTCVLGDTEDDRNALSSISRLCAGFR